jgi:predicted  nucleic acid-binding Zn-ribbon protein
MGYLLAGISASGIAGVVALAIYIAKMASNSRSDLHLLVQSGKDLSEARRDNDGYKRNIENRDHAIKELQEQRISDRAAIKTARSALARATKKLAARGDAASVAADINSTLLRLSAMAVSDQGVPGTEAGEGDND